MECPVCLEIIDCSKNIFKTTCNHEFCKSCLIKWDLNNQNQPNNKTCPLCRKDIQFELKIINPTSDSTINQNKSVEILKLMADCTNILLVFTMIMFIIFMCIVISIIL